MKGKWENQEGRLYLGKEIEKEILKGRKGGIKNTKDDWNKHKYYIYLQIHIYVCKYLNKVILLKVIMLPKELLTNKILGSR